MRHLTVIFCCILCLGRVAEAGDDSPLLPEATDGASTSSDDGFNVATFFDHKARDLPPTHGLSLAFPLVFAKRILWDTGYMLTAPGRWDGCDWTGFGLSVAATGAVMGLDSEIDHESRVEHPRSSGEKHAEDAIENLGDLPGIAAVIGSSFVLGLVTQNEQAIRIGTDTSETLVIASVFFTTGLKELAGRSRPNAGKGPWEFSPFSGNASFPSGHTSAAFSMAATISDDLDNNLWVAAPAYTLASAVGVSRIRANAHFASDVFVGALLGIITGKTVVGLEDDRVARERGDADRRVTLAPWFGNDVRGAELIMRF